MQQAEFHHVQSWAVRSRRQAQLLDSWIALATQMGRLPSISDFGGIKSYPAQDELTVYDVVRQAPSPRYLVAREGHAFRKALDSTASGKFLDDVLPPEVWRSAQRNFDKCVDAAKPIYALFGAIEWRDQRMLCERLLLPFGTGSDVVHIISSFKTTGWQDTSSCSPDNHRKYPPYGFRAVIEG